MVCIAHSVHTAQRQTPTQVLIVFWTQLIPLSICVGQCERTITDRDSGTPHLQLLFYFRRWFPCWRSHVTMSASCRRNLTSICWVREIRLWVSNIFLPREGACVGPANVFMNSFWRFCTINIVVFQPRMWSVSPRGWMNWRWRTSVSWASSRIPVSTHCREINDNTVMWLFLAWLMKGTSENTWPQWSVASLTEWSESSEGAGGLYNCTHLWRHTTFTLV